jgi:YggT family protein
LGARFSASAADERANYVFVVNIISLLLWAYELVLLGRILLSYVPNIDRTNPLVRMLFDLTEPVLQPIRQMLPQTGMIDFSPLVVILIIQVVRVILQI